MGVKPSTLGNRTPGVIWHRFGAAIVGLAVLGLLAAVAPWRTVRTASGAIVPDKMENFPILENKTLGTCPTDTTAVPVPITLTVTLQRPNAPPPHPSWAVPVTFTLNPPGDPNTICHQWNLTLDQSGQWAGLLDLFTGLYDARLKNMHTLRNVRSNVDIAGPMTISMGTLLEGDASNDNWVKGDDFSILRTSYFKQEGQPGFDPRADFDEDNWVKGSDFSLLRTNYWKKGDIPVTVASSTLSQYAALNSVTISVVPSASAVHLGDVFAVIIEVDAGAQQVDAADADMTFPAGALVVVDAAGNPTNRVIPGTALSIELYNSVDNAAGHLTYSAGAEFGSPAPSGSFTLAKVWFRVQSVVTDGPLHFTELTDAYFEGASVLGARLDGTVTVTAHQIFLPVVFKRKS